MIFTVGTLVLVVLVWPYSATWPAVSGFEGLEMSFIGVSVVSKRNTTPCPVLWRMPWTRAFPTCRSNSWGSNRSLCGSILMGDWRRPVLHKPQRPGLSRPQKSGPWTEKNNLVYHIACVNNHIFVRTWLYAVLLLFLTWNPLVRPPVIPVCHRICNIPGCIMVSENKLYLFFFNVYPLPDQLTCKLHQLQ